MIVMWDSIYVAEIPPVASSSNEAVAGYVAGTWPDYNAMVAAFPQSHHLAIAPRASEDADCLDVETGDARPSDAPAWLARRLARGAWRPCFYASLSVMPQVRAFLRGHPRDAYRLWVADWTFQPHIPPGYDACQWTDRALNRNLDESLCLDTFFHAPTPAPAPTPHPIQEKDMIQPILNQDGRVEVFVEKADTGEVFHAYQATANGGWAGAQEGQRPAQWYSLGTPGK